jgi:hypothetical protein
MGPELLIASLWCIVIVYWLWSRRPTLGDTVGSFRHELRVLEHAMPAPVVAPANRRRPGAPPFAGPGPKDIFGNPVSPATAARNHKREELRRRRRDVIEVLFALVLLSLLVALLTHSALAFGLQAVTDIVLFVYVLVLIRKTSVPRNVAQPGSGVAAGKWVQPGGYTGDLSAAGYPPSDGYSNGYYSGGNGNGNGNHSNGNGNHSNGNGNHSNGNHSNGHSNGHAGGSSEQPSYGDFSYGEGSYGDFGSYASLAVSRAN